MRATVRVAPLLLAATFGAIAAPSIAASAPAPAPAPTVASIPGAVQPLVAKIAQQSVDSERFSTTASVAGTVTVKGRKVAKHQTTVSLGEASLAPLLGKVTVQGHSLALSQIGIGSRIYTFAPRFAGKATGRPWMRADHVSAATLFPYHGQDDPSIEVNAGGTGTYTELINLLATADGAVSIVGPATVNGQATTELSAGIQPFALVQGLPSGTPEPPVELQVFVTEAGLPLRVVRSQRLGGISATQTTDILATGISVAVKAPPANKTLSPAGVEKLFLRKHSGHNGGGRKGASSTKRG